jgi:hypothetical protein
VEQHKINSIKLALISANWWNLVQQEVREQLDFIIDNIDELGSLFKESFIALFKYEHARRRILGTSVSLNQPGVLFGKKMSEECYQCSIDPAKSALQLQEWTEPNEADVQACIYLCNVVDQLGLSLSQDGLKLGETEKDQPLLLPPS